ncbi:Xaa-Pro dipeptidase [Billgrantia saliphila]|uniref:Xaa-Pro dipeptidase n=1 Tax=Billgrantia saliphila TaxID=1848458 RepID=UPI000CE38109|nr:Xaa-Pro dipeptidase [Halomonas saliphila]
MTDVLAALQLDHLDRLERCYDDILDAHGYAGLLIYSGHPARHYGDDQEASFCSYGHFQHWTGQAGWPHCWLLIRPGKRPVCHLHAPDDFWHLPTSLPDQAWVEHCEVVTGRFETPPKPEVDGPLAVIGDVSHETARALKAKLNPPTLLAALDEIRVCKSEYEVACLLDANRLAARGHLAARDAFETGGAELDIHLAYLQASRQRESELPYGNIVGLGQHAAVLHYQHYDPSTPVSRRSLLVDAGARYRGYCADITRTWTGPDTDPLFATLITAMETLQQRLIADLRPGLDFVELHARMHRELADLLVAHEVVTGSAEAALANGVTRAFCPHGLGHLLGVQVHDVGGQVSGDGHPLPPPPEHPALRLTRELEAGMVVTIEPGLYFIPLLLAPLRQEAASHDVNWPLVERLAPHGGIRIEDNIRITAQGAENLTPRIE